MGGRRSYNDISPERTAERTSSRKRGRSPSRSRSRTYSPSPQREFSSRRRDRDRSDRMNDRDRDRDRDDRRRRSPVNDRGYRNGGSGYNSYAGSRRYYDGRDNPEPSPCLGVFGMSLHTTERDLKTLFGKYGDVESVQIVYDRYTGRSRGFGFVYFTGTKDATRAKDHMTDAIIDGMKVRVDYSVTRSGGPYRHIKDRSPTRSPRRRRSISRSRSR